MRGLRRLRATALAAGAGLVGSILLVGSAVRGDGGDGATAAAGIQELEHDSAHTAITAEAIGEAKTALERATRMRTAGDESHARIADALSRDWAEMGRDTVRAVEAETAAMELKRKAVDAQARVERSRALVEEAIARVGRLTAQLDEAGRGGAKERTAIETHEGSAPGRAPSTDAGAAAAGRRGAEGPSTPKERSVKRPEAEEERP